MNELLHRRQAAQNSGSAQVSDPIAELLKLFQNTSFFRRTDRLKVSLHPLTGEVFIPRPCDDVSGPVTINNMHHTMHPTLHWTVNSIVGDHFWGSWAEKPYTWKIPGEQMIDRNGLPVHLSAQDTWWGRPIAVPKGSELFVSNGSLSKSDRDFFGTNDIHVTELPMGVSHTEYFKNWNSSIPEYLLWKLHRLAPGQVDSHSDWKSHSSYPEQMISETVVRQCYELAALEAIQTGDFERLYSDEYFRNNIASWAKRMPVFEVWDAAGQPETDRYDSFDMILYYTGRIRPPEEAAAILEKVLKLPSAEIQLRESINDRCASFESSHRIFGGLQKYDVIEREDGHPEYKFSMAPKEERSTHQRKMAWILLQSYSAACKFLDPLLARNGLKLMPSPATFFAGETAVPPQELNFLYDFRGRHIQPPLGNTAQTDTAGLMQRAYHEGAHILR